MDKIDFKALPDTDTPLNPTILNKMQSNIETDINTVKDSINSIYTNSTSGFNITIDYGTTGWDKIPILVMGADNGSTTPVLIIIRGNKNDTATEANYTNLAGTKIVTRTGNKYHIDATIYSTYTVICPVPINITLENGAL